MHAPSSVSGTHTVDDLHIAPDRELWIVANCAGPLAVDGSSDRPLPVRTEVEWLGHALIRAQLLPPTIAVTDVAPAVFVQRRG